MIIKSFSIIARRKNKAKLTYKTIFLQNAFCIKTRILIKLVYFFLFQDTRTHVVVELYDTERSYVESLHTLVNVSIQYNSIKFHFVGFSSTEFFV